jgi:hypothetical protein
MHRIRIRRPSPALIVALVALVFSVAGTATAARFIITSSKQIKPRVIQASDLSKKARKALRGRRGPQGARGPQGLQGPGGLQGPKGDQGEPGPFPDPLPSGKTIRGSWALAGPHTSTAVALGLAQAPISFGFTLPSAPSPHYRGSGAPPTADCPGSVSNPQAAPGRLCIFEAGRINMGQPSICNPVTATCGTTVSRFGANLEAFSNNSSANYFANGTWAATAP